MKNVEICEIETIISIVDFNSYNFKNNFLFSISTLVLADKTLTLFIYILYSEVILYYCDYHPDKVR